jgi:hypothetical protein
MPFIPCTGERPGNSKFLTRVFSPGGATAKTTATARHPATGDLVPTRGGATRSLAILAFGVILMRSRARACLGVTLYGTAQVEFALSAAK